VPALLFGVGANYFFEIAKLRAARVLFANLAKAYGKPAGVTTWNPTVSPVSTRTIIAVT